MAILINCKFAKSEHCYVVNFKIATLLRYKLEDRDIAMLQVARQKDSQVRSCKIETLLSCKLQEKNFPKFQVGG